jgi:hypothetical protein
MRWDGVKHDPTDLAPITDALAGVAQPMGLVNCRVGDSSAVLARLERRQGE